MCDTLLEMAVSLDYGFLKTSEILLICSLLPQFVINNIGKGRYDANDG